MNDRACTLHDQNGAAIDTDEWIRLQTDPYYRFVATTKVADSIVATVWTGIRYHHKVWTPGEGAIFETRIYEGSMRVLGGLADDSQHPVWMTRSDAEAGHARMVLWLRARVVQAKFAANIRAPLP